MRLFAALAPPPEALAHLDAAVAPVRAEHPRLRWAPPERWHLTLAFYGELDGALVPDLGERLRRAASRHRAPALSLAGAGRFGAAVLWAGVRGAAGALTHLAASAAAAGRRVTGARAPADDRPYRPHLTLARARGSEEAASLRPAAAALDGYGGPVWTAGAVHLVRSHLGPDPVHEVLLAAPLRSTP